MARAGDRLTVEGYDDSVVFVATSEETAGELLSYDVSFRPRGVVTLEHVHPRQKERHELVSGNLALKVDGVIQRLVKGQAVVVSPGVPHALVPIDDREVRMRFELRPALRWEAIFEAATRLFSRHRFRTWRGYPNPLLLAMFAREYEPEYYATLVRLAVQRAVLAPLVAVARRLGYEKHVRPSAGGPSAAAGAR